MCPLTLDTLYVFFFNASYLHEPPKKHFIIFKSIWYLVLHCANVGYLLVFCILKLTWRLFRMHSEISVTADGTLDKFIASTNHHQQQEKPHLKRYTCGLMRRYRRRGLEGVLDPPPLLATSLPPSPLGKIFWIHTWGSITRAKLEKMKSSTMYNTFLLQIESL